MTKKIPIAEASVDQLRSYATLALGLEIHHASGKDKVLAKMVEAGFSMDFITEFDAPTAPVASVPGSPRGPVSRRVRADGREEVGIRIEVSDKPGGDRDIYTGVNGKPVHLPRGVAFWCPVEYVEALDHAVEHVFSEYSGGDGGLEHRREVKSYPFAYVPTDDNSPTVTSLNKKQKAA